MIITYKSKCKTMPTSWAYIADANGISVKNIKSLIIAKIKPCAN